MDSEIISMNKKNLLNTGSFLLFLFLLLFLLSCTGNPNKWKMDGNIINTSTFELHAGQSSITVGSFNPTCHR